jgi:hypothetical protein
MKRPEIRIVGAILLIAIGVLSLLQNLGILGGVSAVFWALIFGASGLLFVYIFLTSRHQWWAIIPGFVLLSVGTLIFVETFVPSLGDWGGALVLGGIGLAFWAVYLANREHWWAVIPGGVMLTLALVIGLSSGLEDFGIETGGVFFLGLGLTFALLRFVPSPEGEMKWALIPAAVLLVMGLIITAAAEDLLVYLWPVSLIVAGLYLILRVFRPR